MSRIRYAKHRLSHCFQQPNFSLLNMYFKPVDDCQALIKAWQILQVRNSKVSKAKIMRQMQARRKMQAPKNVFMFEDQYRDFLVFEPSQPDLLLLVINTVLQYNRDANLKGEQQLLLFYDKMI